MSPNRKIACLTEDEATRFWKYVQKTEKCWLWTGAKVYTCGKFKLRGLSERASRVSWAIEHGECPAEKDVLHECDNPSCIRPSHLFLGTDEDNIADRVKKNRSARLHGTLNGHSKLTEQAVREIYFDSRPQRAIAKDYNVQQSTVNFIKNKKQWTCVTGSY